MEYGPQLAALLDGELPSEDERRLREHIEVCPRCAADLAQQQRARAALRAARAALVPPASLQARIELDLARAGSHRVSRRKMLALGGAAAALLLLILAGLTVRGLGTGPGEEELARAASAHEKTSLAPAPVVFTSDDPTAVQTWVRTTTGHAAEVPSLASAGYRLLGARTEPSVGAGAISLVYEGAAGRLTCTERPVELSLPARLIGIVRPPALHSAYVGDTTAVSWSDDEAAYILLGNVDAQTLLDLARLIQSKV